MMTKKDDEGNYLLDTIERKALNQEAKVGKIVIVVTLLFVAIYLFARLFINK